LFGVGVGVGFGLLFGDGELKCCCLHSKLLSRCIPNGVV
jgi:hypothetical protein